MPKYRHFWLGQAYPSVLTRLGAPRRLLTSRQGRTGPGAGPPPDEAVESRRQAGQSSGQRGDAADGGSQDALLQLLRKEALDGAKNGEQAMPGKAGARTQGRRRTQERS